MGARDLLADLNGAGLTVTAEGDRLVIRPASKLTDDMRAALRAAKPALLRLLAGGAPAPTIPEAWTGDDMDRFAARRDRLTRWGWPADAAEAMAERLTQRDRNSDDRVSCTECASYRPGRCSNYRRAGLHGPEVGGDLASMLQRCPGFRP